MVSSVSSETFSELATLKEAAVIKILNFDHVRENRKFTLAIRLGTVPEILSRRTMQDVRCMA